MLKVAGSCGKWQKLRKVAGNGKSCGTATRLCPCSTWILFICISRKPVLQDWTDDVPASLLKPYWQVGNRPQPHQQLLRILQQNLLRCCWSLQPSHLQLVFCLSSSNRHVRRARSSVTDKDGSLRRWGSDTSRSMPVLRGNCATTSSSFGRHLCVWFYISVLSSNLI